MVDHGAIEIHHLIVHIERERESIEMYGVHSLDIVLFCFKLFIRFI